MCGCRKGNNRNFVKNVVTNQPVRQNIVNSPPPTNTQNVQSQSQQFNMVNSQPFNNQMTPERRKIERLQREAIKRSFGK